MIEFVLVIEKYFLSLFVEDKSSPGNLQLADSISFYSIPQQISEIVFTERCLLVLTTELHLYSYRNNTCKEISCFSMNKKSKSNNAILGDAFVKDDILAVFTASGDSTISLWLGLAFDEELLGTL